MGDEQAIAHIFLLPNELKLMIFRRIGFFHFISNPEKLCISQRWFALVYDMLNSMFANFDVSTDQLHQFLNKGTETGRKNRNHQLLEYLECLHVSLSPCDSLDVTSDAQKTHRNQWDNHITKTLLGLDAMFPKSDKNIDKKYLTKCHTFRVTHNEPNTGLPDVYPYVKTLPRLITGFSHTLQNLTLDFISECAHANDTNLTQENAPRHFCSVIRTLLPNLRELRLRLPNLCPLALDAKVTDTNGNDSTLRLCKLSLNINDFCDEQDQFMDGYTTAHCLIDKPSHREVIPAAVLHLKKRMANPRVVRVFWRMRSQDDDGNGTWKIFDAMNGEAGETRNADDAGSAEGDWWMHG